MDATRRIPGVATLFRRRAGRGAAVDVLDGAGPLPPGPADVLARHVAPRFGRTRVRPFVCRKARVPAGSPLPVSASHGWAVGDLHAASPPARSPQRPGPSRHRRDGRERRADPSRRPRRAPRPPGGRQAWPSSSGARAAVGSTGPRAPPARPRRSASAPGSARSADARRWGLAAPPRPAPRAQGPGPPPRAAARPWFGHAHRRHRAHPAPSIRATSRRPSRGAAPRGPAPAAGHPPRPERRSRGRGIPTGFAAPRGRARSERGASRRGRGPAAARRPPRAAGDVRPMEVWQEGIRPRLALGTRPCGRRWRSGARPSSGSVPVIPSPQTRRGALGLARDRVPGCD